MKKATTDNPSAETPAPAIPPGTEADVTLKYKTRVDPNQAGARERDLNELAGYANELEAETLPLDELGTFCAVWANYGGYNLNIVRLPDPPERRLIGQTYARPCFNLEQLGATSFDPTNLIASLQYFNQGSGGVFRLWLTDHDGTMIPGAHVQRVAIADPPRSHNSQQQPQQQPQQQFQPPPQPPREREKSDSERQLEQVKDALFTKALERALNPPQQQAPTLTGTAGLPAEDQAALLILNQSGFIPTVFTKLTEMAQQVAQAGAQKEPSWKERAIDAGVELATKNPAIVERLSSVVERIVARVLPDPKLDGAPQQYQQQFQPQPVYAPTPQPGYAEAQPLPETPDPGDDLGSDDDTMDIIDNLTTLLNSDKPLALSDPLFKQMQQAYPLKFKFAIKMIIASDLDTIINWIKLTGGAPYVILLEGHGGAYVIERMAELQKLIIAGDKAAREKNANTQTSNEQAPSAPETDKA